MQEISQLEIELSTLSPSIRTKDFQTREDFRPIDESKKCTTRSFRTSNFHPISESARGRAIIITATIKSFRDIQFARSFVPGFVYHGGFARAERKRCFSKQWTELKRATMKAGNQKQ